MSYPIFDFLCLTLSLAHTHGIAKYARIYIEQIELQAKLLNYYLGSNKSNINQYTDTHTHAHTTTRNTKKEKKKKKKM